MNVRTLLQILLLAISLQVVAQQAPILIADQTFKADGKYEFVYAFAEGDRIDLRVRLLSGKAIKSVELIRLPDMTVLKGYAIDSTMEKTLDVAQTGLYLLRIVENGLGKKVCRFTLHRTPASALTARFDTRVWWDWRQYPQYQALRRQVSAGKQTATVASGGRVTVGAGKFGLGRSRAVYQFVLPPHTVRWAYRISVGQAATEARRQDADQLANLLQSGSFKLVSFQPETALAAFALGAAIDMTKSTTGEDVEYALLDGANQPKFLEGKPYDAFIWQGGVAIDAQRRYSPLEGACYFGLKNNNWLSDIEVFIDIEAVTETPILAEEIYLEPIKP